MTIGFSIGEMLKQFNAQPFILTATPEQGDDYHEWAVEHVKAKLTVLNDTPGLAWTERDVETVGYLLDLVEDAEPAQELPATE